MRKDPDSTDFWLHINPPGGESSFNTVWKSRIEPAYNEKEKSFVHTPEAALEGDRFIHLNVNAVSLLSQKVRENLRQGIKIHVVDGKCAEIKNYHDELTEPVKHLYDLEEHEDFEAVRDDDGIIFGIKGIATLHERKAFLITREKGKPDILRVDYVNHKGKIIRHDTDKDADDGYVELGKKTVLFAPRMIADLWVTDTERQVLLSSMLVQAYLFGVRFAKPPLRNDFVIKVSLQKDGIVRINTNGEFYGVGDNLVFSIAKNYKSNKDYNTRSLEGTIVHATLAYRWFFNKPNLKVKVIYEHDKILERKDSWQDAKEYRAYMKAVKAYEDKGIVKLSEIINKSVSTKWARKKSNLFFDNTKANLYKHINLDEED